MKNPYEPDRECPGCGTSMDDEPTNKVYCTKPCKDKHRRARLRAVQSCTRCADPLDDASIEEDYHTCSTCREKNREHLRKRRENDASDES